MYGFSLQGLFILTHVWFRPCPGLFFEINSGGFEMIEFMETKEVLLKRLGSDGTIVELYVPPSNLNYPVCRSFL